MKLNLYCPINPLSIGYWGLNLLEGLYKEGAEIAYHPIGPISFPDNKRALIESTLKNAQFYDPYATTAKLFHPNSLKDQIGRGKQVAITIFELASLTDFEVHQVNSYDLLVVPTNWAKQVAISSGVKIPVEVVPLGVDREIFNNELIPDNDIYHDKATKFLTCGKWEVRKSHDVIIDCFCKAFEPGDDVRLIVNCHNPFIGEDGNDSWQKMYTLSPMGHKVHIFNQRLNNQQNVAGLMLSVDCGVFVSRAEGWNLPLLEMMSCGKEVIATNATAHTEFVNEQNSRLVSVGELEDAFDGVFFHGQGQWPSLTATSEEQIVAHMREVHRKKQVGELTKNVAGIETAKRFSWESASKNLYEIIKNV